MEKIPIDKSTQYFKVMVSNRIKEYEKIDCLILMKLPMKTLDSSNMKSSCLLGKLHCEMN